MPHRVFLFGEAEKGEPCTPLICTSLFQLSDMLGNPPEGSLGIDYAVQTLLYQRELIFFRVHEEGFSTEDYMRGLHALQSNVSLRPLAALCMPGVGDATLIAATTPICIAHSAILILTEKDLYDYLNA